MPDDPDRAVPRSTDLALAAIRKSVDRDERYLARDGREPGSMIADLDVAQARALLNLVDYQSAQTDRLLSLAEAEIIALGKEIGKRDMQLLDAEGVITEQRRSMHDLEERVTGLELERQAMRLALTAIESAASAADGAELKNAAILRRIGMAAATLLAGETP